MDNEYDNLGRRGVMSKIASVGIGAGAVGVLGSSASINPFTMVSAQEIPQEQQLLSVATGTETYTDNSFFEGGVGLTRQNAYELESGVFLFELGIHGTCRNAFDPNIAGQRLRVEGNDDSAQYLRQDVGGAHPVEQGAVPDPLGPISEFIATSTTGAGAFLAGIEAFDEYASVPFNKRGEYKYQYENKIPLYIPKKWKKAAHTLGMTYKTNSLFPSFRVRSSFAKSTGVFGSTWALDFELNTRLVEPPEPPDCPPGEFCVQGSDNFNIDPKISTEDMTNSQREALGVQEIEPNDRKKLSFQIDGEELTPQYVITGN